MREKKRGKWEWKEKEASEREMVGCNVQSPVTFKWIAGSEQQEDHERKEGERHTHKHIHKDLQRRVWDEKLSASISHCPRILYVRAYVSICARA